MYIGCHLPQVPDDEELQLGQLYFLVPLSKSKAPLSLQELCALASKASASLAQSDNMVLTPNKTLPYSDPKNLAADDGAVRFRFELTS
ncbi:hypothetical protein OIU77_028915 [Salix suchowensis]|nr:hypothetical protein OIU77_028915 [Salix suchowensis]